MKKERPVCPHCGSNAVGAEGPMQYDEAAGEWRSFGEPYDNSFFCQACERSEFNPEWKEHKFTVLRISAIVDACFRLIVDGESVLPWRRWGSAQELV